MVRAPRLPAFGLVVDGSRTHRINARPSKPPSLWLPEAHLSAPGGGAGHGPCARGDLRPFLRRPPGHTMPEGDEIPGRRRRWTCHPRCSWVRPAGHAPPCWSAEAPHAAGQWRPVDPPVVRRSTQGIRDSDRPRLAPGTAVLPIQEEAQRPDREVQGNFVKGITSRGEGKMETVRWFDRITLADDDLVGGMGANLGG